MKIEKQYDARNLSNSYSGESKVNENFDPSRKFLRQKMSSYDKNSSVLDMGCGSGLDLMSYEEMGFQKLVGIDPSEKLLKEAKVNVSERVELIEGTFESIPLSDESMDILVSRHALHYSKDLQKAISECARVLKPGGRLLLVVSHPTADAESKADSDGNITITLFKGKVSITFPQHKLSDYFSENFYKNFDLIMQEGVVGKEQDRSENGLPNALCFEAVRK